MSKILENLEVELGIFCAGLKICGTEIRAKVYLYQKASEALLAISEFPIIQSAQALNLSEARILTLRSRA